MRSTCAASAGPGALELGYVAVPACWICDGSVSACAQFSPEPFLACEDCGFAFRPDLDDAALEELYADGDYEELRGEHYLASLKARRRDAQVRLRYVGRWARGGRLLDVGAAGGAFVAEAELAGFDASGIEPVPSFARAAREQLGCDVRSASIEDAELPDGGYEVVTLWHVLEHLRNPVDRLWRLADALSGMGILAVEVPNAASAVALHMGAAWTSLEPTVHVNQFTPHSLRLALRRAGFEVLDLRTTAITPYLTLPTRLDPRHLAGRGKAAVWLRDPRCEHPSGQELLRAVARRSP
jgi:2-polyprenyl-3-methyl-5-hydroxy-6-metoxy-1,4-benzoquinol methylase